ncbi:GTPase domain-containing protein [Belnapia rosea]|uniref:50S ribosome-binding GTPase n=1 Tax=Belnapia rosea TaxID=938405 RepID=A0A1G7ATY9_9PROT|nr:GTPase domain-containing protein [Belnapia rosea]SDB74006.1 50S ribosome-binding GTPase [Belnapia rosea]SDE17406.1 50S ribosome-binding GTPase [Belnapia rosea]
MFGLELAGLYLAKWAYDNVAPQLARALASPPPPDHPSQVIALVGATCAGKSTLGNRLAGRAAFETGPTHGTTSRTHDATWRGGWVIRDTPGLLDDRSPDPVSVSRTAKVVVYVASGQLLRPELDALRRIREWQRRETGRGARERHAVLFCGKADQRHGAMPRAEAERVEQEVRSQMADLMPSDHVVFGSALNPDCAGVRRLGNLLARLSSA